MAQTVKNLHVMWETGPQSLGLEHPLEKEMTTHSSILAWKTPWTEECGGLQSIASQFPFTLKPPTLLPGTYSVRILQKEFFY